MRKSAYFAVIKTCKIVPINKQKSYVEFKATPDFIKVWIKRFSYMHFLMLTLFINAQKEQIAQNYFDRGEFEKALVSFQVLAKDQPYNGLCFQK